HVEGALLAVHRLDAFAGALVLRDVRLHAGLGAVAGVAVEVAAAAVGLDRGRAGGQRIAVQRDRGVVDGVVHRRGAVVHDVHVHVGRTRARVGARRGTRGPRPRSAA